MEKEYHMETTYNEGFSIWGAFPTAVLFKDVPYTDRSKSSVLTGRFGLSLLMFSSGPPKVGELPDQEHHVPNG